MTNLLNLILKNLLKKSVGLAFEVHDTYKRKKQLFTLNESKNSLRRNSEEILNDLTESDNKIEQLKLEIEFRSIEPTFIQTILYSFCYIGILTGPYFKFRTYIDWLNTKNFMNINSISFMKKRGRMAPFIIIIFLVLSKIVSFQVNKSEIKTS